MSESRARAEKVTDRWEELERSCLHAERLKDQGLPFHCILSLRGLIAEALDERSAPDSRIQNEAQPAETEKPTCPLCAKSYIGFGHTCAPAQPEPPPPTRMEILEQSITMAASAIQKCLGDHARRCAADVCHDHRMFRDLQAAVKILDDALVPGPTQARVEPEGKKA